MTDQTKQRSHQQHSDPLTDFEAHELKATMHEFFEEEKKANTNIWNFATIAGIAMFFVAMVYVVQLIGLSIGPDVSDLIGFMPLIGGVIVTMVGLGYFVGEKKQKKKRSDTTSSYKYNYDFEEFSSETETEDFTLKNDLGTKSRSKSKEESGADQSRYDRYAFTKSKKLYKSRTNKKIAGVCGGLAKYFGINAGVIRALFLITLFAGGGTSLLIYIALAIALDKEPLEMMDEFDY